MQLSSFHWNGSQKGDRRTRRSHSWVLFVESWVLFLDTETERTSSTWRELQLDANLARFWGVKGLLSVNFLQSSVLALVGLATAGDTWDTPRYVGTFLRLGDEF